jgi:hypothetical protein
LSALFDASQHLILLLAAVASGSKTGATSSVVPADHAKSPAGIYAFSETQWLNAIHLGYGGTETAAFRSRIFATTGGRLYVPRADEKTEILAARRNEAAARAVARDLAAANFTALSKKLVRAPSYRDLYAAHMFGLDAAVRLAALRETAPKAPLSLALPELSLQDFKAAGLASASVAVRELYEHIPEPKALSLASEKPVPTHSAASLRGSIPDRDLAWLPPSAAVRSVAELDSTADARRPD